LITATSVLVATLGIEVYPEREKLDFAESLGSRGVERGV